MGKLKNKDIKHVSKLSSLKLTKKEIETFGKELSNIVSYIENLKEVNTEKVEPTSQTTGLTSVFRDDEVVVDDTLSASEATSASEKVHNDLFMVPMVLKEKE
jgi:aspartyl-tRNA(Asn)/glutamyl-tRNA(Gln) amidotransferase subunit C